MRPFYFYFMPFVVSWLFPTFNCALASSRSPTCPQVLEDSVLERAPMTPTTSERFLKGFVSADKDALVQVSVFATSIMRATAIELRQQIEDLQRKGMVTVVTDRSENGYWVIEGSANTIKWHILNWRANKPLPELEQYVFHFVDSPESTVAQVLAKLEVPLRDQLFSNTPRIHATLTVLTSTESPWVASQNQISDLGIKIFGTSVAPNNRPQQPLPNVTNPVLMRVSILATAAQLFQVAQLTQVIEAMTPQKGGRGARPPQG